MNCTYGTSQLTVTPYLLTDWLMFLASFHCNAGPSLRGTACVCPASALAALLGPGSTHSGSLCCSSTCPCCSFHRKHPSRGRRWLKIKAATTLAKDPLHPHQVTHNSSRGLDSLFSQSATALRYTWPHTGTYKWFKENLILKGNILLLCCRTQIYLFITTQPQPPYLNPRYNPHAEEGDTLPDCPHQSSHSRGAPAMQ